MLGNNMVETEVSPPHRGKSGRKLRKPTEGNPGALWRRIRDNWDSLNQAGMNPDLGTVVGKLYIFKIITKRQASAARLYAEVAGRYDRFFGVIKRTAASPAYERGSHGQDSELEKRIKTGTLPQYERMAGRAKKAWQKLQSCIPNDRARTVIEDVCLYDVEPSSEHHSDLVKIFDRVADKFGIRYD